MKIKFFAILFVFVSLGLFAQEKDLNKLMQERNEYYFTFELNGNDDLPAIAHAISVDRVDGNVVTAYANNKQFAEFQKMGYEVTLQTPPSMVEDAVMWDGSNRAAYDWDQYPTYPAYEAMMQQYATNHPDRCTYMELGTLNSGRKIMVCRINNGVTDGKPKFLYTSTMHGDEVTGMMLMLRLIDELCTSNDARIMNLVNNLDIFISPCTNPDGTYHGGNNTVNGATRYNGNNVDLNRHFPDFDDGPHPDGADHYENEAQWMMDLAQEYLFTMSANYHGGAEVMNYPWDTYQPLCADDAWWQLVSHEYADLCHQVSSSYMTMSGSNNGIINGYAWYTITGSRQDYMNYYGQCREVTIECSNSKTPSASQMPNFWNINHNSMLAYMEQCFNGIHGIVTDAETSQPVVATITLVGHDHHGSEVTSHLPNGDFHRPVKAGTYNVKVTATGYLPYETTVTVADGETVNLDIQLEIMTGIYADFTASATAVAVGGSVNFTDASLGYQINSWSWEFEGGTPATSTAQNPTVAYNEAGTYGVRLTVTNANGDTDTKYMPNYISAAEAYNMSNGTITTCDAMFYDDGGPNANYNNNRDFTMIFMPGSPEAKIQIAFQSFEVEDRWDHLYIYDGTSTSATQIGDFTGTNSPGTVTATNAAGALTFRFTSDSSVNKIGWAAHVTCIGLPLEATANVENQHIHVDETNTLYASASGGSGVYTYSWSPVDNLNDPTAQNPVFTATEAGEFTYTVTVTSGDDTTTASVSFIVTDNSSVDENGISKVSVYPNPASSTVTIDGLNGFANLEVEIVNLQGQVVTRIDNSLEINIEDVEAGIYFIKMNCDGQQYLQKIVIK